MADATNFPKGAIDRSADAQEGLAKPAANGIATKPRSQFHLAENSTKRKGITRSPQ